MAACDLTANQLRDFLHYDPETGIFTRRKASGTAKVGDTAGWVERHGYSKISIAGRKYYAHRCAILYMNQPRSSAPIVTTFTGPLVLLDAFLSRSLSRMWLIRTVPLLLGHSLHDVSSNMVSSAMSAAS